MRVRTIIGFLAMALAAASTAAGAGAGKAWRMPAYDEPEFSEQIEDPEALAHAVPGPRHEALEFLVGRFFLEGGLSPAPGRPSVGMTGVMENRWTLGGRFIESRGAMEWGGRPIRVRRLIGFDSRRNEYVIVDLDNWRVFPLVKHGVLDGSGKVLTFTYDYPALDGPPRRIIETMTVTGEGYRTENRELLPDGTIQRRSQASYLRHEGEGE